MRGFKRWTKYIAAAVVAGAALFLGAALLCLGVPFIVGITSDLLAHPAAPLILALGSGPWLGSSDRDLAGPDRAPLAQEGQSWSFGVAVRERRSMRRRASRARWSSSTLGTTLTSSLFLGMAALHAGGSLPELGDQLACSSSAGA
jgi:hypothetical protein